MSKQRKQNNQSKKPANGTSQRQKPGPKRGGTGKRWPKTDPNAGRIHEDEDNTSDSEHKFNDVSWYAKNPSMLEAAASKSYNNPVGVQVNYPLIYGAGTKPLNFEGDYSIPGVYVLRFAPSYGIGTDYTSPMNVVGQNIFAYLRSRISGSRSYEYQDVMLYLYAMDNAFMLWNWAKRMYGYSKQYSQYNRYMPNAFSTADGVTSIVNNEDLSDFRFKLDLLAAKLSSFAVPAVMPVFTRHSWMVSNIYRDSDIKKCQFYMFVPGYYYVYNETDSSNGGFLECRTTSPSYGSTQNAIALTAVTSMIDECLMALSKSEDIGTISGDIKNAYGDGGLYTISPIEADYTVEPVYNEEVLNQIHNSTLVNAITNSTSTTLANFNITQDPNNQVLTFNPSFPNEGISQTGALLNMPWDNVTPANTMVGTRLTATRSTTGTGDNPDTFSALGTEWINERYIVTAPPRTSSVTFGNTNLIVSNGWTRRQIGNNIIVTTSANGAESLKLFSYISNFDWHPLMPVLLENSDGSHLFCGMLGDISNYTLITGEDLNNLHQTAVMSEFNIPEFGTF